MEKGIHSFIPFVFCVLFYGCASYQPKPFMQEEYYLEWTRQSIQEVNISDLLTNVHQAAEDTAFDLANGLDLSEAEIIALGFNPQLIAQRKQAEVLDAGAQLADLWDDPSIGFELRRILENVENAWLSGLTLNWSLPVSGRLALQKDHASAEAWSAWVQAAIQESGILTELRKSWLDRSIHLARLELGENYLKDLEKARAIVELLADAGEIGRSQARIIAIEQVEAEHEVHHLQTLIDHETSRIASLLGLPTLKPLRLIPSTNIPFEIDWAADWEMKLFSNNLQLKLEQARYEIAEKRLRLEVRKQYPDIQFGPIGEMEDGEPRLGFGIQVPVPILNGNARGIAESHASREAAQAMWKASVQDSMGRIHRLRITLEEAEERHHHLSESLVPLVEQQLREQYRLAELGEFNILIFVDALQQHHDTGNELVSAVRDMNHARIDLRSTLEPFPLFSNIKKDQ